MIKFNGMDWGIGKPISSPIRDLTYVRYDHMKACSSEQLTKPLSSPRRWVSNAIQILKFRSILGRIELSEWPLLRNGSWDATRCSSPEVWFFGIGWGAANKYFVDLGESIHMTIELQNCPLLKPRSDRPTMVCLQIGMQCGELMKHVWRVRCRLHQLKKSELHNVSFKTRRDLCLFVNSKLWISFTSHYK